MYLGSLAHEDEFCRSTAEVLALAGCFPLAVMFSSNFQAVGIIFCHMLKKS